MKSSFALVVALVAFLGHIEASVVENNETNVRVFVNHLSSCNLNHGTGNMLCINQDFNTVIQYHDVKQVAMCPYHYCVLFNNRMQYSCTGYVLTLMGGNFQHHLNPLTPNTSYVGFTGNPDGDVVEIKTIFLGYNIWINVFEQNVDNYATKEISSIRCMDPYSTHLTYKDGEVEMFGAHGIVFRGFVESLLVGVVIHCSIAFALYFLLFMSFKNNNTVCNLFVVPLITFLSCYMILFVGVEFVAKIFPFIVSSIFGVIIGYILASIMFNTVRYCKKKRAEGQVTVEESTQFVIEEDNDDSDDKGDGVQMTEINLSDDVSRI